MTAQQVPYETRLKDFLKSRFGNGAFDLDDKSIDELKQMLPKPPNLKTPEEGFTVFDLLHSEPNAPRVIFRSNYLYPDGARCDIPSGPFFRAEGPPDDNYLRATRVVSYWRERLRPIQTEFDRLKAQVLKDQKGMVCNEANVSRLEELFQEAKPLKDKLLEAAEAKEKAHPDYRTPEQREIDAKYESMDSDRRARLSDRAKKLEI